jgi:nucleoid DNA-binding protein
MRQKDKKKLLRSAAKSLRMSPIALKPILDGIFHEIALLLIQGQTVHIDEFGIFTPKTYSTKSSCQLGTFGTTDQVTTFRAAMVSFRAARGIKAAMKAEPAE